MAGSRMNELRQRLEEIADVTSAISLLRWDQETYMPPKAAPGRGQQLATLSALRHRLLTAPEMGRLLAELRDTSDRLDPDDAKLVEVACYDYTRTTKLPESFVQTFAEEQSKAFHAWVGARDQSDFAAFQPHLERLVELLRQKADLLGYQGSPYNALLEDYERGMTADCLQNTFGELAKKQSALVERIIHAPKQPDTSWLDQEWDEGVQWDFTLRVLEDMGYDLEAGRQDKSVHPFTTHFDLYDVRVTTRVNRNDLFSALMGSIHEGGHALYDQGFQEKDRRTPLADGTSLGIHESQSRMWENVIGRSLPFWKHYTPVLRERFPGRLDAVAPEQVYAAVNRVRPSFIRVEADECTYNLHVMLRFEIELPLIEGELKVAEVPELWGAKMKQYLGLDVTDDAKGCLQDIHWSYGSMGYFPTYALGNLYAAQLFERIIEDIPDLWDAVEAGNFEPLRTWLRTHVHQHGRRKLAHELLRDITGGEATAQPYLNYLEGKYGALYGLTGGSDE